MLRVKRLVRRLPGSSLAAEAETHEGPTVVLKLWGAGNGPLSLMAELLVNRAAAALGWPVPQADVVHLAPDHPWELGTDEFDDVLQRSPGENLGLQFVPDAHPVPKGFDWPATFRDRVCTLDAAFLNYDRTRASANVLQTPEGTLWVIDHGACQFLDPALCQKPFALPPHHCFANDQGVRLQHAEARALIASAMAQVAAVPTAWLMATKLSPAVICERLEQRLERI